jgi:hypothetical protein
MIHISTTLDLDLVNNPRKSIKNSKEIVSQFQNNSWLKGEGAIYVLVDQVQNPGEFIYVGSSTRVKDYPHVTIKGGMNRKYSYKWIHHQPIYSQLEAHFITFGNVLDFPAVQSYLPNATLKEQIMTFIETIEAEIVYEIREKTGKWPKYQNEIHFHTQLAQDELIKKEINQTMKILGLYSGNAIGTEL